MSPRAKLSKLHGPVYVLSWNTLSWWLEMLTGTTQAAYGLVEPYWLNTPLKPQPLAAVQAEPMLAGSKRKALPETITFCVFQRHRSK